MKNIFYAFLLFSLAACAGKTSAPRELTPAPAGPVALRFELADPPLVGTTPAGQKVHLGGFSGLRFLGRTPAGKLQFLTLTDRGPNAETVKEEDEVLRPFLLPKYQPRLVWLEADPVARTLVVTKELGLQKPDGSPLSGLPQRAGIGHEAAVDSTNQPLTPDPYGMDLEAVAPAADGSFWVAEEYGPSIARFSAEGKLLRVLKPGNGLPKVLEQRRINRGFEGMALAGDRLFAVMQGPLDNPRSPKQKNAKKSRVTRLVEIDLKLNRTAAQYAIYLDHKKLNRIGDLAVEGPDSLLFILQDGEAGPQSRKEVVRVNLQGATNLQLLPGNIAGPGGALESLDLAGLERAGIRPLRLEPVTGLAALGVTEEKVEGIDIVEGDSLALVIDNDFSLDGTWDRSNGRVGFTEKKSALYLLPKAAWRP